MQIQLIVRVDLVGADMQEMKQETEHVTVTEHLGEHGQGMIDHHAKPCRVQPMR